MANRNGMGPNNNGPLTGRGMGNCNNGLNKIGKVGLGLGAGLGMAWGCRNQLRGRGFGVNRGRGLGAQGFFQGQSTNLGDSKESLEAYKEQLEQEISLINQQLTTTDSE